MPPEPAAAKRARRDAGPSGAGGGGAEEDPAAEAAAAGGAIVELEGPDGKSAGPALELPLTADGAQLNTLLNRLLRNEDARPYSFFIDDRELGGELGAHLRQFKVSMEAVTIKYRPQAFFKTRPLTRSSATIPGHTDAVLDIKFSPDGRHLASGSGDTTVRFWNLGTQLPLHQCRGHRDHVLCVAWSPDAQLLASGGMDGLVHLWDPATGAGLGACQAHKQWITSLAWEPAHLRLPAERFVTGSKDTTARVWDARTRRCLLTLGGHTRAVSAVKWGGDGVIYTASRDSLIFLWDSSKGSVIKQLKGHAHWVNTLTLSSEYALRTGAFDHRGAAPADPAAAREAARKRYEAATGGRPVRLVSGSDDFTMILWEPAESKGPRHRLTGHQALVNQVLFSPDGNWIASAGFDKCIKLWNGATGKFVANFRGHVGPVYQIAWSPDSRLILSGSKDSTLKVWSVRTGKIAVDLPGHADEVYAVDWAPTGTFAGSGGKDRMLKLWRH